MPELRQPHLKILCDCPFIRTTVTYWQLFQDAFSGNDETDPTEPNRSHRGLLKGMVGPGVSGSVFTLSPQEGRFREFLQCDIDVIDNDELSIELDAMLPAIRFQ